ncbi:hypothetical protein, partial [uncultured Hyphomicrobium sp.]|uniref:hypothetical protein n=1 Tax=uncultured Hyphomicrobium sp. TaxID=194373 RepID=UPI0026011266
MMKTKATILAAVIAAAALQFAGVANAAPVGPVQNAVTTERANLQSVDYRPYRHCHRARSGKKWCHGGAQRRYGYYGYGPGVNLYIGRGYRHHHH